MSNDTDNTDDAPTVTTDDAPTPRDPLADDFRVGDPCIDLATGRTVVVVDCPEKTVAEWSGDNGYDLLDNYANERCRASPNDPVVEAAYVSSVQSEPNGPRGSDEGAYTFPSSRLARVTVESIDGVDRVYDAVARDVLEGLFGEIVEPNEDHEADWIEERLTRFLDADLVEEARELADVERTIGGDDNAPGPSSGGGFET